MATNPAPFPTPGETPYGDKVQTYIDSGDDAVEAKVSAHESASNPHDQYLQKDPITISSGVDLDTLTSPGLYVRSTSVGNAGLNYPVDDFAGYVTVWTRSSYVRQEANLLSNTTSYGPATWERTKGGSNPFSPWARTDPQTVWGTGNPNGVHSARIGTVFRNTENGGWNGARVWRKDSGTGSTGWVVESGDTGWRNISSLIYPGATLATTSGRLLIRRVGDAAWLTIVTGAVGFENRLYEPIPGFRPRNVISTTSIVRRRSNPNEMFMWRVDRSADYFPADAEAVGTAHFSVDDDWPDTLPGTPL